MLDNNKPEEKINEFEISVTEESQKDIYYTEGTYLNRYASIHYQNGEFWFASHDQDTARLNLSKEQYIALAKKFLQILEEEN